MARGIHAEAALENVYDTRLLGWLLTYARPHRRALAGCVALLLLFAALALLQPYLIKLAIDQVLHPGGAGDPAARAAALWPLAALYAGSALFGAAVEYVQGFWLRATGQAIIARIREDVFAHLQRLSLAFFDANPTGRLVTRATNDVEALDEMYTSVLVNLFKDVFGIVGAMAVMLALDWRLALVSFAVIPFVVAAALLFQRFSRAAWRDVRARLAEINASLAESLSGMRVLQIFAREAVALAEFRAVNDAYYQATMHQLRVYAVFRPLLELLTAFALVGLIAYGGGQALVGAIGIGTLYAFTSYNRQLFEPVNALAEKYNVLQSALAAAERICQLLATPPAVADPVDGEARVAARTNATPAVEFRSVSFAYQGSEWVLRQLSFAVMPGETVAFVGHTGAGKSTIMGLLARFYDVQEGAVLVDGVDVRDWPQAALRRRVGAVMQDVFLFAGDVSENISLGDPAIDAARVEAAARVVGADAFIRRLPGGYGAPVVERGAAFSAGQRQLVAFARALAHDPEVLVLDEATANIDSDTEAALQAAMKALARNRTTLIVAHRLSTIQGADRIYVLHQGTLREEGRHAELVARGGLYATLWQLQFDARQATEA